jgi:branched-subunit amino acid transport protein
MNYPPLALGLIICCMGVVTYAIRLSLIALLGQIAVPRLVQRALRFVPPAVLSAIILPELLRPAGTLTLSLANPRPLAGLLAALVVWRTRSALLAIAVGMAALWLLRAAFPH